jgi:hypothetical protein
MGDLLSMAIGAFVFLTIIGFALELNILSAGDKAKERVAEVNVINNEIIDLRMQFEQGSSMTSEQVESQYNQAIKKAMIKKMVAEINYDTGR